VLDLERNEKKVLVYQVNCIKQAMQCVSVLVLVFYQV